ncbi:cobyrinate a,c-diamide synthase [Mycolicibacterium neoaurum]|uniref:cobyrinate a,c-diamide synthase n=1 Tax=Mycolicibacterium neoaurum TaxID=1795 RepID=UPI0026737C24|nr:cobyrinate a,c-diamide synthase [Mycolicibacterium neoaurum]MDO3401613.1 cobyrinate a,c-diamide synthase [Mycolicibacterium neoaurum]
MVTVPAVVIAAPSSGSGKTTLATGLIGALRRAGHTVAPFKVGPDFIDPGYHGVAAGRPGRNLDPLLVGEQRIGPLYQYGSAGADIAVIEGVMGLFDGRIEADRRGPARGSTAQVAGLLGAPVVMVIDGAGHSQSLAALLHGFATFDAATRICGVVLNRVGSARHEEVLRQACEVVGLPVLGAIPRDAALSVPSRHLGLITAAEHGTAAAAAVDAMAALVARHVDIEAVVGLAAARVGGKPWTPRDEVGEPVTDEPVVALAAGRAFTFGYAEHRELLLAAGAAIAEFDPLSDSLPPDTAAIVVPGGFPEQYPADLAANVLLRTQIRVFAQYGPVHAECAGLTYLMSELDGHAMCGVLPGKAYFTTRLTLGYRDAVAVADSPLCVAGSRLFGHEFHRTTVDFDGHHSPAWQFRVGDRTVSDGAVVRGVHAAYLHTHPAGQPDFMRRFVRHATIGTSTRTER